MKDWDFAADQFKKLIKGQVDACSIACRACKTTFVPELEMYSHFEKDEIDAGANMDVSNSAEAAKFKIAWTPLVNEYNAFWLVAGR